MSDTASGFTADTVQYVNSLCMLATVLAFYDCCLIVVVAAWTKVHAAKTTDQCSPDSVEQYFIWYQKLLLLCSGFCTAHGTGCLLNLN